LRILNKETRDIVPRRLCAEVRRYGGAYDSRILSLNFPDRVAGPQEIRAGGDDTLARIQSTEN